MNATEKYYCECCEKALNPETMVWLELNTITARYHREGEVPEAESQGSFPFGKACAKRVLANGGRVPRKG